MYSNFRSAVLDKSVSRYLLPALAAMALLAVTPAFASLAATSTGGEIDWMNMGMKLLGGLALFLFGMEQMADALKAVANGVNSLRSPDRAIILVTHYQRLLDYVEPDFVHVLSEGRIIRSGDKSLALELEERGYDWVREAANA